MMTFHCLAGIAAIWLPESKNRPLPHTMTDLEVMKQKTKNICYWSAEWSIISEYHRDSTIKLSCVLFHGTLVTFKSIRYLPLSRYIKNVFIPLVFLISSSASDLLCTTRVKSKRLLICLYWWLSRKYKGMRHDNEKCIIIYFSIFTI